MYRFEYGVFLLNKNIEMVRGRLISIIASLIVNLVYVGTKPSRPRYSPHIT